MNNRREFLFALGASALVAPLGSFAQQQDRVWRVGFFYFGTRQSSLDTGRYNAFVRGMRELGYFEGKNLVIEARFGDGKIDRLPPIATELVRECRPYSGHRKPIQRVTIRYHQHSHCRHRYPPIPIEGWLRLGQARWKLHRPHDTAADLGAENMRVGAAVPRCPPRVLLNPDNVSHPTQMKRMMLPAQKIGVQVVLAEAGTVADIEPGIGTLAQERANAVLLFGDTFFVQQLPQIAQAALKYRLASMYLIHDYARVGGLMSYGADVVDNFRRAATYVHRVLKGAKTADLPFEQPTRYIFAINLKTAKALGLTIPQSLLLRADEVIQ
jgi:putative ABC transport system substrate-binding protein